MNRYIQPPFLNAGDKAVIVSPSGCVEESYIHGAKEILEDWGLTVTISPNALNKYGRFAGTVEERLCDLQAAMDDKDFKLIFCSRGGYGAVHLLEKLDFTVIRDYPKWLVGYSDITALHFAFLKNGILSLHAPMAKHLTQNSNDISTTYLKEILLLRSRNYELHSHSLNLSGKTQGILFGGNLSVLAGLTGTPYFRIPENGILFIEDIGEYPYKIDRMMWNLKLTGIFEKLNAVVVGKFTDFVEDESMGNPVYERIHDMLKPYGIPVVFDFPVGHCEENYPLIQGGKVSLNVGDKNVTLNYI